MREYYRTDCFVKVLTMDGHIFHPKILSKKFSSVRGLFLYNYDLFPVFYANSLAYYYCGEFIKDIH